MAKRKLNTLILSGKTPRSKHMRSHTVTNENIEGQGMHPSKAWYMEGNSVDVAKTTTLRESAGPHRDNRQTGKPKNARMIRLAW